MRKKLLPLLEKEFNLRAVEHLGALAELAREDEALLSELAQASCRANVHDRAGGQGIETEKLLLPGLNVFLSAEGTEFAGKRKQDTRALSSRMVRLLADEYKEAGGEISVTHVDAVLGLAKSGENGKVLQLPGGVDVRRDDDWLIFLPRAARGAAKKAPVEFERAVTLRQDKDVNVAVKEISCVIRLRSIDWSEAQRETIKKGWAALDRGKLQGELILRNLRPGDRMRPVGHRGTHKLKHLLNEKRISRWEREGWPVLEDGKNIVWARGFVAAEFAVTKETRKAILVSEEKA